MYCMPLRCRAKCFQCIITYKPPSDLYASIKMEDLKMMKLAQDHPAWRWDMRVETTPRAPEPLPSAWLREVLLICWI